MTEQQKRYAYIGGGVLTLLVLIALIVGQCTPPDPYRHRSLLSLLVELRDQAEYPGLTVRRAAAALKSPEAAFAFVRDRVRYSPYQGHLQSAETVLCTRVANVTDRVVLLDALLHAMGKKTVIKAPLDQSWPGVAASPGTDVPARSPIVAEIARRIHYDLRSEKDQNGKLAAMLADYAKSARAVVAAAEKFVSARVGLSSPTSLPRLTDQYDKSWYWIETVDAGGKTEAVYDPSFPAVPRPRYANTLTYGLATLAPSTDIALWVQEPDGQRSRILDWHGETAGKDVSLTFMPAQNTFATLTGPFTPQAVALWVPMLAVGGTVTTGTPLSVSGNHYGFDQGAAPYAPDSAAVGRDVPILDARIVRTDASAFPTIRVQAQIRTNESPSWIADQFRIREGKNNYPVRIRSLSVGAKPVVVVTDVSGSMNDNGKLDQAKLAMTGLIDHLLPESPFALISFSDGTTVQRPLSPLGDGAAAHAAVTALTAGGGTGIYGALAAALSQIGDKEGTVILLTDGQDTQGGDLNAVLSRLENGHVRVFTVGVGSEPDDRLLQAFAEHSRGRYFRFASPTDLQALYAALGDELSGLLTLEYDTKDTSLPPAPVAHKLSPKPHPRNLSLRIAGYGRELPGSYVVPDAPATGPRVLILRVTTGALDGTRRILERPVAVMGTPDTPWDMIATHRLYFDIGAFHPTVVWASYLTRWIDSVRLHQAKRPDFALLTDDSRVSLDQVSTINGFRMLAQSPVRGGDALPPGPNVYVLREGLRPGSGPNAGHMVDKVVFDAAQYWGRLYGTGDSDAAFRMEVSAALAEGAFIGGGDSVRPFLAHPGAVSVLAPGAPPPASWSAAMTGLRNAYPASSFLLSSAAPDEAWRVDPSTRAFQSFVGAGGALAKGASDVETAAYFDRIDKLYAGYARFSGAAASVGGLGPSAPLVASIAAFKREELKLWCFSTIMLGYVSDAISDQHNTALLNQSPEAAKARAAMLCKMKYNPEDFARHAAWAAAKDGAMAFARAGALATIKNPVVPIAHRNDNAGTYSYDYKWPLGNAAWWAWQGGNAAFGLWDMTRAADTSPTPPAAVVPMTPEFHNALANALALQTALQNPGTKPP